MNGTSYRRVLPALGALALGVSLTACGAGNESGGTAGDLTGTLNGGGASSQEKAQAAWVAGVQDANSGLTVNYEPVGSGDGRANFISGNYLFAGTDSALDDDEGELTEATKRCGGDAPIQVPAYVSPIAVMYNLPGVDLQLDATTATAIFEGKIKKWNDPKIAALNEGADLPDSAITPVHRQDDSGTTENFVKYLAEAGDWAAEPDGLWPSKLGGEAAEGTSGVVGVVRENEGTIGYADHSATEGLQVAALKVGEEFVAPSAEAAAKILAVSEPAGLSDNDLAVDLARDTAESGVYPNVLVSYLLACPSYDKAEDAELVKGYLSYILSEDGQNAAHEEAGSAPLDRVTADAALKLVDAIA